MRTTLKKWGNSLGVRIPKAFLNQNNIQEGTPFEIISRDGKIILEPQPKEIRQGWAEAAKKAHQNGDDHLMMDFPNKFDWEDWQW
jgi:antitoxin MazE